MPAPHAGALARLERAGTTVVVSTHDSDLAWAWADDVVLLRDVAALEIAKVWADGQPVSEGTRYTGPVPRIAWRIQLRSTSCFCRKLYTSPPSPQPKQWK